MKNKVRIAAIILMLFTNAYAQGAEGYDWQTCLDSKTSECLSACTTSEDTNCGDNCSDMAKDKCLSEGLNPPT